MRARDAFAICHEVYVAARELLEGKVCALRPDVSAKYLWRPDIRPRLAEYVADFALAGARALGDRRSARPRSTPWRSTPLRAAKRAPGRDAAPAPGATTGVIPSGVPTESGRSEESPRCQASEAEIPRSLRSLGMTGRASRADALRRASPSTARHASRLILFRVHYLGGAPYEAARRHLGISERTWADWVDEIRARVGRELIRAGVFPPGRYFHALCRR